MIVKYNIFVCVAAEVDIELKLRRIKRVLRRGTIKEWMSVEKIASRIIDKWLRKGNMARCMRDILPHSGLSLKERERVARIVHDIIRYKRRYDAILQIHGLKKTGRNYVMASLKKIGGNVDERSIEIRESMSKDVARAVEKYPEFLKIINLEPDTVLCTNFIKTTRKALISYLQREGFNAREYLPESAVITESSGRYSKAIKEGLAHVQDASSQMVAKITGYYGDRILDYCAGSGGKSLAMASLYKNKKELHAYDINKEKLRALRNRMERHGAIINIHSSPPVELYDVVLVDAPCSGIGAASRNPEAKYVSGFEKFKSLQMEILENAKNNVKEGGILIYVVCSFSLEETVEVMGEFLENNSEFEIEEIRVEYPQYFKKVEIGGFITLGDILYMAVLRKL